LTLAQLFQALSGAAINKLLLLKLNLLLQHVQ
jgi:hypothetical protein